MGGAFDRGAFGWGAFQDCLKTKIVLGPILPWDKEGLETKNHLGTKKILRSRPSWDQDCLEIKTVLGPRLSWDQYCLGTKKVLRSRPYWDQDCLGTNIALGQ